MMTEKPKDYDVTMAFCSADEEWCAHLRRQFRYETGPDRYVGTNWDHETKRAWRARCAARKAMVATWKVVP